jgi:hypothetical protein
VDHLLQEQVEEVVQLQPLPELLEQVELVVVETEQNLNQVQQKPEQSTLVVVEAVAVETAVLVLFLRVVTVVQV